MYYTQQATRHASTEATQQSGYRTAYEEALSLIEVDKKERLKMLERVDKEITRVKKGKLIVFYYFPFFLRFHQKKNQKVLTTFCFYTMYR